MAIKIRPLRSTTPGLVPTWGDPDDYGEFAINLADRRMYVADELGNPVVMGEQGFWSTQTADFLAAADGNYLVDAGLTVLLPLAPGTGISLRIADPASTYSAAPLTIDGNGFDIDGAITAQIGWDGADATLVFDGIEWKIVAPGEFSVTQTATIPNGADLDFVITSGFYLIGTGVLNGPPVDVAGGQMLITHGGGASIVQTAIRHQDGRTWSRTGEPIMTGGAGVWGAWIEVGHLNLDNFWSGKQHFKALQETTVDVLVGETDIDPSRGSIQYRQVAGDVTLTESVAEGQSVLMGFDLAGGLVTHPIGTVWMTDGGFPPVINALGYTFVTYAKINSILFAWANQS